MREGTVDEGGGGWGGFPQRGSGQRLESKPTSKGGDPAGGLRGFKFIQDVRRTTKRWRRKSPSLFRRNPHFFKALQQ